MKIGVWIPNCRHLATPEIIRTTAVRAEALGYDSVWVSDHVVVPHANVVNFGETIFDPLITLGVVAGATRRVQLGTTVLIIPYRNAVVTAKMISSLDALSGGRVLFGIGAGWVAAESAMLGLPFKERGAMTDEYLRAMQELWTSRRPVFNGAYTQFNDLVFEPKPIQKPHPPIWVGGDSPGAFRRVVALGDGWHATSKTPAQLREALVKLRAAAEAAKRPFESIELSVRFGITDAMLADSKQAVVDVLAEYKRIGLTHVVLEFRRDDLARMLEILDLVTGTIRPAVDAA
jgi:probable F420-dependent oxidoreductase